MKPRTDLLTRFKSGEVEMADKPISVRLPKELDNRVRALPNRTEWLRKVIEQAIEDEPEVEKLKQILLERDCAKRTAIMRSQLQGVLGTENKGRK